MKLKYSIKVLLYFFVYSMLSSCITFADEPSFTSEPIKLSNDSKIFIGKHSAIFFDKNSTLSFEEVTTEPLKSFSNQTAIIDFNQGTGTYWIKYSFTNPDQKNNEWALNLNSTHLEFVNFYFQSSTSAGAILSVFKPGDPYIQRPLYSRFAGAPFLISKGESATVWLEVKTTNVLEGIIPVVSSRKKHDSIKSYDNIILSIYFCSVILIFIYSLSIYFQAKNKINLYYSIFMLMSSIAVATYEGFFTSILTIIPDGSMYYFFKLLLSLSMLIYLQIIRYFIDLYFPGKAFGKIIKLSSYLFLAIIFMGAIFPDNLIINYLEPGMTTLTCLLVIYSIFYIRKTKSRSFVYFKITNILLVSNVLLDVIFYYPGTSSLFSGSTLPFYLFTRLYGFYIFSYLIVMGLNLSLGYYFSELKEKQKSAEKLALESLHEKDRILEEYSGNLKKEVEAATNEVQQQADQLKKTIDIKSQFLANISHEFRTPLTLIEGSLQQILSGNHGALDSDVKKALDVPLRNSYQLHSLIEELLSLSELQAGVIKLQAHQQDVCELVRRIAALFDHRAKENKIDFNLNFAIERQFIFLDAVRLEKAITNILSNAFKFTPENGQIKITLKADKEDTNGLGSFVHISIEDSGTGITDTERKAVFDRFVRGMNAKNVEGSGIGLSISQEFVQLHGGEIKLKESSLGGCCFTIELPLGDDHITDEDLSANDIQSQHANPESVKKHILLVEDNNDMRAFIKGLLSSTYNITEARDGAVAWGILQQQVTDLDSDASIDLVLSDIMMPNLDGIGLLEKIRLNDQLATLPVVLLTARSSQQDRINALKIKADEYLAKPFSSEELLARIQNILDRRDAVLKQVSSKFSEIPELKEAQQPSFIQKARSIINAQISNPGFDVQRLAFSLNQSEPTLRRRFEELLQQTPAAFIRQCRLEHSQTLLNSGEYRTIAEVALEVGFSNAGYFSRLYQKTFGSRPVLK